MGRTNGVTSDFAKITLDPGWRFTKRVFGEQTLGHVYLTYDGDNVPVANVGGGTGSTGSTGNTGNTGTGSTGNTGTGSTGTPAPSRFNDTVNDIYAADINRAVQTGFISGFEDNTFRPTASLTREQLVSMVLGALGSLPNVKLDVPTQATGNPYSDVEASRWSAARIQFARDNNIITGYQDGSFRPAQPVTRAELMAVLRRAAEYGKAMQGQQPQIQGNRPAATFADTNGHWANPLISQMSSYCGVASPLNETGSAFAPDTAAQRNYAAAATLRTLSCLGGAASASR
ncbi:MAG: S-layer homology domain-containing protein [Drouetiella hepatica Uher 2000/2452]|uniref:S-layer homology domain-containing protein n=1 Tax=Drouetiella hepatica Uher 2000/2452 TaxID=904376 RepID=A0A951Q9V7_9CYAN|nr:S-layer homology domain-containing protein [Drouetiella hepatica Uher 2000/2452]